MYNNSFGPTQTPTPMPGQAPMPNPAPAPNPYQPNPAGMPINPMGAAPQKKSKAPLIIILIVAAILIIGGVAVAIILMNNSGKADDSKDKTADTSKETKKTPDGGDDGDKTDPVRDPNEKLTVTLDGLTIEPKEKYGDYIRSLSKVTDLYERDNSYNYKKLTDINAHLAKTYTFDMDSDKGDELPSVYIIKDLDDYDASYTLVYGVYVGDGDDDNVKKYDELSSYVAFWCGEHNEKISVNGHEFTCRKSKGEDVKKVWKTAEESYGNYWVQIGNYRVDFMFSSKEDGGALEEIMFEYSEVL